VTNIQEQELYRGNRDALSGLKSTVFCCHNPAHSDLVLLDDGYDTLAGVIQLFYEQGQEKHRPTPNNPGMQ